MDKALEKINELNINLEKLIKNLKRIEKLQSEKENQKSIIEDKIKVLNYEKESFEIDKNVFENKNKNIQKKKIRAILSTIFANILALITVICSLIYINNISELSGILILGNLGFFPLITFSGMSDYFLDKKYLKTHDIQDIQNNINEKNKEILFSKQDQKFINDELEQLKITKEDLLNRIDLLEQELKTIENIRNNTIMEYINYNKEFDDFANNKYEKEQQKQLIKKKDSNK